MKQQQQQQQHPAPPKVGKSSQDDDDHDVLNCMMDHHHHPQIQSPPNNHNLPQNNPIVLLEHINLNVGSDFGSTSSSEKFFFQVLQCRLDKRTSEILSTMQNAGGKANSLWWANIGYQQFHLVGYDDPEAYTHLCDGSCQGHHPWSSKQTIHGSIGLEWPNNSQSWKVLRERLEQALKDGYIEQYDEISIGDDAKDPKEENSPTKDDEKQQKQPQQHKFSFFRIVACNGNIFQIHPQQQKCLLLDGSNDDDDDDDDDDWYFIGPTWPPPMVRNHPIPLPMIILESSSSSSSDESSSNSNSNHHHYNVDSTNPCVLGMRFVEYYVPPSPSSSSSSSSLDIIKDTYEKIFPGLIYSYQKVPYYCNTPKQQQQQQQRDCLQILIGHFKNPQYIRYVQLLEDDIQIDYDGHHLALYINNFIDSYQNAKKQHDLIYENPVFPQFYYTTIKDALHFNEFRIRDFIDFKTNQVVFQLEHEIRSLNHSGYSINQHVWEKEEMK